MVLSSVTFIIDPTMNLLSEPYHEYERGGHNFRSFEST